MSDSVGASTRADWRHRPIASALVGLAVLGLIIQSARAAGDELAASTLAWPTIGIQQKPWAYWWWMGSAVDKTNLTRELTRYQAAGYGGVHIIPIYGAKGWETNYIQYLSPRWMEMLGYTVSEARRLGMDVDMTTGTGWCFGGPRVTDEEANATVVNRTFNVSGGRGLDAKFDRQQTQALVAFSTNANSIDLKHRIQSDGSVDWVAPAGHWRVYAVSQKPSGQKVKRPSPGGEGHMLNLLYPTAVRHFVGWVDEAFARYRGPKPRAQYHDSYEYRTEWSPDFLSQFQKRRGYRLETEFPALFGNAKDEHTARVLCDYRETASDIMVEDALPVWVNWSHKRGFLTRNEAHGSPGNLLDLYAVADIPETEMFYRDRNKLISKFASSAAHVTGKNLVGCETGTWLQEHFTETLADMKYLLDDLFLSGVNHVFYHGTCYSPDEAGWPGWLFYASFEMNPRNSIWHDVPTLNAYVARCQSVLQSGQPDNDILLYWPIHDFWSQPGSKLLPHMTVHARDWFESQPIGHAAEQLWNRGYSFDYISDRQLADVKVARDGSLEMKRSEYRIVLVPDSRLLPLETLEQLLKLAQSGATVVFENELPQDVPGLSDLESRRARFKRVMAQMNFSSAGEAKVGKGRVLVGKLEPTLSRAGAVRETLFDQAGLMCIRRSFDGGRYYFIANRGDQTVNGWLPLAINAESVVAMDPLSGKTGVASSKASAGLTQVSLQLQAGESVILRAITEREVSGPAWPYVHPAGPPTEIAATWNLEFLSGGPALPPPMFVPRLDSWTKLGGAAAQNFAGTARYTVTFDAPQGAATDWLLSLGKVCQSARVRLNGEELGTLIAPPFQIVVKGFKPKGNKLEVEVTNVSANAIRYYDREGVKWKNFHDINFVNLNYRPFDASEWPLTDSGLLGPVTLTPVQALQPLEAMP